MSEGTMAVHPERRRASNYTQGCSWIMTGLLEILNAPTFSFQNMHILFICFALLYIRMSTVWDRVHQKVIVSK
jgi:hypothetical protein